MRAATVPPSLRVPPGRIARRAYARVGGWSRARASAVAGVSATARRRLAMARQATERRLVHRLEALGYKVALEPAAA